jgi:two-component system phosphate regulon sensor histidine kinase PhoR
MSDTGGIITKLLPGQRREREAVERYFDALCRMDSCPVQDEDALPPLPDNSPWRATAEALRATIVRLHRKIEELQQARAALEIRCRRATSRVEEIQAVLAAIADPVLAIDEFDRIVLANRSAEELFELEPGAAETKLLQEVVQCRKLVQLLVSARQRKTPGRRSDELEIVDSRGQTHSYRATAVKLSSAEEDESRHGGAAAVLRDIAEQKALQKRNAEFVSAVSHEMKAPLSGIKAYVELLVDGEAEDDKTREEFLGVISDQADRLQRLVENMLNLARIEAGVVKVDKQPRSLNEILEESLRVVQPMAEAKGIRLGGELSPLYLGVLADRDMMLQAAINLLSNAVKYTPSGGAVTLRSRLDGERIRFEVQDTGVGLSEEDRQRVFEKFYRVKKDQQMASGTGLGLPLAKHIVEDVHGGRLSVESKLGEGSTFIVELPQASQMRTDN